MQDFRRDFTKEHLQELTPKERVEGLSPNQRLEGLSLEERLKGFSPQEIESYLKTIRRQAPVRKRKNGRSSSA
jgi:hypothetical protein